MSLQSINAGPSHAGEAELHHAPAAAAVRDADEANPGTDGERNKVEVRSGQEPTQDHD